MSRHCLRNYLYLRSRVAENKRHDSRQISEGLLMLFSERIGITSPKSLIQKDFMDDDLRNGLWNCIYNSYIRKIDGNLSIGLIIDHTHGDQKYAEFSAIARLLKSLWEDFFKRPYDEIRSKQCKSACDLVRSKFFEFSWHEVYNFLDYVVSAYNNPYDLERNNIFITSTNKILERELSAYRFVGNQLAPITSQEEINSIENALKDTSLTKSVNTHLKIALELFADRKTPDYRNSIKESISAVEAICGIISGKATSLGDALKEIERKSMIHIHTALKKSFESLYGYTSNADGIRHALLDETNLDSEDSKFMLVSCAAFINYLLAKSSKAGIQL
jgi:hypothetical protein